MLKEIHLDQTLFEICNQHPEVITIMSQLGFENITKPGMLHTAGRVMTIPKGCRMKSISIETVRAAFQNHGFDLIDGGVK